MIFCFVFFCFVEIRTFDYVLVLEVKIKSLILSSNSTWLMYQVELKLLEFSTSSSSKFFVGFDWAGVQFEHVIVIVKLSLKIHYSAWFDYSPWTSWSSTYISIFFPSVFPANKCSMTRTLEIWCFVLCTRIFSSFFIVYVLLFVW